MNRILKKEDIDYEDPRFLYKFYPINRNSLDSLVRGYIWLGDPGNFNDPFDNVVSFNRKIKKESCFEYFDLDEVVELSKVANEKYIEIGEGDSIFNLYRAILKWSGSREELKDWILRTHELVLSNLGMACFSSSPYEDLMWSHYADGHRGFCLEFYRDGVLNSPYCREITYVEEIPEKVSLLEFIENYYDFAIKNLYVKKKMWSYENEWRFFKSFNFWFPVDICKRKETGLRLKSIIFGLRTSEEDKRMLMKILSSLNEFYCVEPDGIEFDIVDELIELDRNEEGFTFD